MKLTRFTLSYVDSKMSPPFDKKPYAIIVFIYFMQVVYLCTHTKKLKIVKLFSLFFDIKHTPWNKSFFFNNFILSWTALFTLRTSSACYCLSQCGLLFAHFDLVSELVLALNFWHLCCFLTQDLCQYVLSVLCQLHG